ncbi:hypothetical protein EDD11_005657 [Mortierella claussenii]|nr:hypothetical protein EDD11_005657 [Mortierella claussenii]
MTSVSQPVPAPHVKVERPKVASTKPTSPRVASPKVAPSPSRDKTVASSMSSVTAKPTMTTKDTEKRLALPTNKRYSDVQSKVGSLEAIHYKPKPSEKKVQSFKQDFSHVKSKVDAKLILPEQTAAAAAAQDSVDDCSESVTTAATRASAAVASKCPTVVTGVSRSLSTAGRSIRAGSQQQHQQPLSPSSRISSVSSIRTAATAAGLSNDSSSKITTTTSTTATPKSPSHSRHNSTSSLATMVTSPPMSPTSPPTRRMSKHIIPTQKVHYDHVKSKVGSFDNISYTSQGRGRAGSQTSNSADESQQGGSTSGGGGGTFSPSNDRSRSPSARSTTSSSGGKSPTSPSRRPSFKIPPSKKVDYSNVKSKVNSLEFANHVPQGGNLRVFSEKLTFREQAQSKIAKEINIVQFYDYSYDESIQEEQEEDDDEHRDTQQQQQHQQQQGQSQHEGTNVVGAVIEEDFEPPKNILSVLDEMAKAVDELVLENQRQQQQQSEQQYINGHHHALEATAEPLAAL